MKMLDPYIQVTTSSSIVKMDGVTYNSRHLETTHLIIDRMIQDLSQKFV